MFFFFGCKPPTLQSNGEVEREGDPLAETTEEESPVAVSSLAPGDTDPTFKAIPGTDDVVKGQFPLSRVITNAAGRSISGTIIGKMGEEIAFKRDADGKAFVLSISQLSPDDQLELSELTDESVETVVSLRSEQSAPGVANAPAAAQKQRTRNAKWHEVPETAFAESKALGLPVYVLFTGSDWCPPCKMLEKTIHEDDAFSEFADKNLVLLVIDFPKRKAQSSTVKERNRKMASDWQVRGYPSIFLTNGIDGKREIIERSNTVESFLSGVEIAISKLPSEGRGEN